MSLRIETIGEQNLSEAREETGNVIFAFWHNRIMPMVYALRHNKTIVMVSKSTDGELISRTISAFGARTIRGSTGKGGGEALLKAIRSIKKGGNCVITPDGPQGPACRAQDGVVHLAAMTSRPVVPVSFSSSRQISLHSWDRFKIPLPFSRAVLAYGKPVKVSKNDDREQKRKEIEQALQNVTSFVDGYF